MKLFVTSMLLPLLCGVALSGDAVEDADDVHMTGIDIGRLGVINDKTQEIWLRMRSDEARFRIDDPVQLSSSLRQIVWQYNQLREDLCDDRFMVEQTCGAPYLPAWIHEKHGDTPSSKELRARQAELEGRVIPLWDATCERLRKVIPGDNVQEYCSVE